MPVSTSMFISILQSSIKTQEAEQARATAEKFQFYKVRLKQLFFKEESPPAFRFQFYKVRLKPLDEMHALQALDLFQFYKVRLKHSSPS